MCGGAFHLVLAHVSWPSRASKFLTEYAQSLNCHSSRFITVQSLCTVSWSSHGIVCPRICVALHAKCQFLDARELLWYHYCCFIVFGVNMISVFLLLTVHN